ncbi:NAD-dependent epimerase/dehydratase family protein [Candidatus Woesearchaeota archaeon]|nr:NAD-dependent epimerase/dehydratase family protein [Candidatus Woesearchaeota archaeon]
MSFWKDKNVFVTGATGIVGSTLVSFLLEKKAHVTILLKDDVPNSNLILSGNIKKVNIVRGILEDYKLLHRTVHEYEIDTVFHLGAQAIVQTANRSPLPTFETNIRGTWNILEAARTSALIKRVVIASSDKAYGDQERLPYTEDAPLIGRHPYDVSKSCADLLSQAYAHSYDLPVAIARCANIYGPGDLNFNRIVPETMKAVLDDENPKIRSDGKFIRDYIYVKDVANAYMELAEQLDNKEVKGQAFNFSAGNKLTVLEIVEIILKIAGKKELKPVILNQAKNEIRDQYLDAAKAKKILNWKAKYGLEESLKQTFDWYKSFLDA